MADERPMRMDAYYYGFEPTGEECIDRVLSAVACAGKAFHHTQAWANEDCTDVAMASRYEPFLRGNGAAEWIQNAAIDATAEVTRLRAALGEALDMAEMMYTEFTALERVRLDRVMVDASGVPDHLARLRTLAGKET
jgi:hypothetical protein